MMIWLACWTYLLVNESRRSGSNQGLIFGSGAMELSSVTNTLSFGVWNRGYDHTKPWRSVILDLKNKG